MENRKFSLEKPAWIMRNCWSPWLLDLQSQQSVGVFVCIKSDRSKTGMERNRNDKGGFHCCDESLRGTLTVRFRKKYRR